MLCKVETKTLSDALRKARKAVYSNATLDILTSFLLVARGSTLMVVATALGEWTVAVKVKAEVKQEGKGAGRRKNADGSRLPVLRTGGAFHGCPAQERRAKAVPESGGRWKGKPHPVPAGRA